MNNKTFKNPVIKGCYPDPSICRVGEYYYMVTSSFYYFPALPVFRSKDLVNWEQISNAISRSEQLDFRDCDSSEGLWAATIRYHNNKFYIINTLSVNGRATKYNFIVTAEDPSKEWSDAVIIEGADGIDPSLYFDDEGRMWYMSNCVPKNLKYPSHKQIYICEIDKETFQFIGERKIILDGALDHSEYTEAPHIYFINNTYFLITACGGTQTNHCVNMYKSEKLLGPYIPCPRNPIVTNRNIPIINSLGVAVVGHGDLVESVNGQWHMALLGIRPYEYYVEDYSIYSPRKWIREPDRNKNAQFNLGREVFIVPIVWDFDGWPLVDNENGMVNLVEKFPELPVARVPFQSRIDNFDDDLLNMAWCMRRPPKTQIYSLTARKGNLRLFAKDVKIEHKETPAMIVRRQQHYKFFAQTVLEFNTNTDGDEAGIVLIQNERYSISILKQQVDNKSVVSCVKVVNGHRETIRAVEIVTDKIYLSVVGDVGVYSFYYGKSEFEMNPLALEVDGSILSTVISDGFIGTYLGMYCYSLKCDSTFADFDWFKYEVIEE